VVAAELSHRLLDDGTLSISFSGDWLLEADLPSIDSLIEILATASRPSAVAIDASGMGEWDTGLVAAIVRLHRSAEQHGIPIDDAALPEGARQLVTLAFAVREREGARREQRRKPFLESVGERTIEYVGDLRDLLSFTGELVMSLGRLASGRGTYLRSHLAQHVQEAGAEALPIVSLISFLIGMIFAFVGVMQLRLFGAGIYTADLVGIAMVREMAPIMTGIIMAGRTGAAYAAEIGTMKVNEEIDALTTLGIDPIDFLVSPRVIALVLMLPLLTLYGSLMGILGGTAVGLTMLDVSLPQYVAQTISAIELHSLLGGLFKSIIYGSLVALAGCQQGMACGNSAMAVGQSTTKAVVMGIVLIIVSASVLTVIYINLGI
jgi:phospholipid/cholesterol/gamma-HCH transport system permease protein